MYKRWKFYWMCTVPLLPTLICFSVQDVCFSNSGSTKFAFAFRNDKIPSQCSVKVFCKDMYGAYCSGYRLELWIRELHARHTVFNFFPFLFSWKKLAIIGKESNLLNAKINIFKIFLTGVAFWIKEVNKNVYVNLLFKG